MKTNTMTARVDAFLAERQALGFCSTGPTASQLHSFDKFFDEAGHQVPLTIDSVVLWARDCARIGDPRTWARRLEALRPFAAYLSRNDADTEFPETQIFGKPKRRATPHIYSEAEVLALLKAARDLPPEDGLRLSTYEAFFGLIAATGLRVSEAINLRCDDVDLNQRCLMVRMTKFKKSWYVPFHPTVADALGDYLGVRDRFLSRMPEQAFFVSPKLGPLKSRVVHWTFQKMREHARVIARGAYPAVRIHDFRHTFICRRIQSWQANGTDIDNAIAALSTYVGHAKISDTYWYLTGIPDLMAVAGNKFERFAMGGAEHD